MKQSRTATIEAANRMLLVDGDLDAIGDFFTEDYVAHGTARELAGHGAVRKYLRELRRAFPALEVEVEILVRAKDRVAWQRRMSGLQCASFGGFPATGRRIAWRDMIVTRFRAGKIAEDWVITDVVEQLLRSRKRAR